MAQSRCGPGCQGQAELPLAQDQLSATLIWAPGLFSLVFKVTEAVPEGCLSLGGTGDFGDPGWWEVSLPLRLGEL